MGCFKVRAGYLYSSRGICTRDVWLTRNSRQHEIVDGDSFQAGNCQQGIT